MISAELQPDQQPERWDDHVCVYERVFEPFTLQLAQPAIASLGLSAGRTVLDVGAGSGGAALAMAAQGLAVTAVDASPQMVSRILARAADRGLAVAAHVMDGQALEFADQSFDAALSVLGVILFPDAARGLAEMRRVVRHGGAVSVVTWTEPQDYELAAELRAAIQSVRPEQPPASLPAQLRYREEPDFRALFSAAGLGQPTIVKVTAHLRAPSARWLAEHMGFAPGMASMLASLGDDKHAVIDRFVCNLEKRQGMGPIAFAGVVFVGTAKVSSV